VEWWIYPLLVVGGFAGGLINAFAGGGSFITFPLLLLAGLPPQVANATNRIAIVLQCIAGAITYHRHGVRPWRDVPPLLPASIAGAIVGSLLASRLDPGAFRTISAVLLVGIMVTIFIDTRRWTRERSEAGRLSLVWQPVVVLMAVYGGFLQIGMGSIILALFVLGGGYDVVRANALKFGLVWIYQAVALGIFAGAGQVDWAVGATLAAGNIAGGIVGAHAVVKRGTRWVRYLVLVSALLAVAKLLLDR
jgi:uncharacterized membrane protein YfcA